MTVMKAGILISAETDQAQRDIRQVEDTIEKTATAGAAATRKLTGEQAALQAARQRQLGLTDGLISAETRLNATSEQAIRLATASSAQAQTLIRANQASASAFLLAKAGADEYGGSLDGVSHGMRQLGVQVGDFTTQVAGGANPFQAFAQQIQQVIGALQLMNATTDSSETRMGRFIAFMSGPWGIGISIALPIIAVLVGELLKTGEAADTAKAATIDFTDTLTARTGAVDNYRAAIDQLTGSTQALINTQALMLDSTREYASNSIANIERDLQNTEKALARTKAERAGPVQALLFGGIAANVFNDREQTQLKRQIAQLREDRRALQGVVSRTELNIEDRRAREASDPIARQRGQIEREQAELRRQRLDTKRRFSGEIDPLSPGPNVSADDFQRRMTDLERRKAALSATSPRGRSDRSSDAEARKLLRLNEQAESWAARTADAIAKINDQWSEQPTRIAQANDATRQLQAIIREAQDRLEKKGLGGKQIAELKGAVTGAEAALKVVSEGINKPFRDMVENYDRQRAVQLLILSGREREAEVLSRIQQLSDQIGTVTSAQRAEIERIVAEEERLNDMLARREEILGMYQQAIGGLRSSLEDLFSGGSAGNFIRNFRQNFRQLQGQLLVENIFGGSLRELEKKLRRETGMEGAVETLERQTRGAGTQMQSAGDAAGALATALTGAAARINGTAARSQLMASASSGVWTGALDAARGATGGGSSGSYVDPATGEIVVQRATESVSIRQALDGTFVALSPNDVLRLMSESTAKPIMAKLDDKLGVNFFRKFSQTVSGTMYGYTTAGPVGAVLGGIQGLVRDLGNGGKINASWAETISKSLGQGLEGAQTGFQVAQFGKMLGIKTSSTGGSIGGALGSLSGIPGGDIIGSIAGSLIGGALKSSKRGTATVGVVDGSADITGTRGNSSSRISAAKGLAGGALDALDQIIGALDGELGAFSGSIGVRNKKFVVDPTGQGRTKGSGVQKFDSEADAQAALLRDLISDGAVKGISAAVQQALGSSPDIEKAMKEALAVQDVELLLGGLTGQWSKAFREFEAQASERLRIARQYGFDVAALEARNAEDRLKLQERLLADQVGSLQDLITDMTSGSLFEGSSVDRRSAILAEIEKARAALGKGEEGAGDRLAQLYRDLNDVSKSVYGTTGGFAQDRSAILDQARSAIADTNARLQSAQGGGDPAVVNALDENNGQNAQIIAALSDQNVWLGSIAADLAANTRGNNYDRIIDMVRTS